MVRTRVTISYPDDGASHSVAFVSYQTTQTMPERRTAGGIKKKIDGEIGVVE